MRGERGILKVFEAGFLAPVPGGFASIARLDNGCLSRRMSSAAHCDSGPAHGLHSPGENGAGSQSGPSTSFCGGVLKSGRSASNQHRIT